MIQRHKDYLVSLLIGVSLLASLAYLVRSDWAEEQSCDSMCGTDNPEASKIEHGDCYCRDVGPWKKKGALP